MCSSLIFIILEVKEAMRFILLFLFALFFFQGHAQNYAAQDMTLQLDENGLATLTPEDVLVNTTGTLWAPESGNNFLQFHYDQEAQTLDFIDDVDELCLHLSFYYSHDRNPISKKEYMSGTLIDCCDSFSSYMNVSDCEIEVTMGSIWGSKNECNFSFDIPILFSFDRDGILYESNYDSSNGVSTFDLHSNIRTFLTDSFGNVEDSGFTYDFENHRLIGTTRYLSNNLSFVAIDIETAVLEILFEFPPVSGCFANAIEYIGNDMMLVGSYSSNCSEIYAINLVTQEITVLANNYSVADFLFIEDEIPDATLSTTQFTCNDLGEQTVDITVIENGIPVNYQSTINVVSDFSVRNCQVFRFLNTPDPNGSNGALVDDYTGTIQVVSSCSSSFTITQYPVSGTLIPYGETVNIILTVTDEFGNTTLCQIIGCSGSFLAIEDQTQQNNFIVSPIPTKDIVTIENRKNMPISAIEIYDINGRLLETRTTFNQEQNNITLSFNEYSSGMYFVTIKSNNQRIVKQVIKSKWKK